VSSRLQRLPNLQTNFQAVKVNLMANFSVNFQVILEVSFKVKFQANSPVYQSTSKLISRSLLGVKFQVSLDVCCQIIQLEWEVHEYLIPNNKILKWKLYRLPKTEELFSLNTKSNFDISRLSYEKMPTSYHSGKSPSWQWERYFWEIGIAHNDITSKFQIILGKNKEK